MKPICPASLVVSSPHKMSATVPSTFWKKAGMSYLSYANASAAALRASLKEPLRAKAVARSGINFKQSIWNAGVKGEKGAFFCACGISG